MNLNDAVSIVASICGILTFCGGVLLWIGSKLFATRKDFHEINNKVTGVLMTQTTLQTDISWIKERLSHEK